MKFVSGLDVSGWVFLSIYAFIQSVAEIRMKSGSRSGHCLRIAVTTSRVNRVRFSNEPPYSSVRTLLSGREEFMEQIAVRGMNFDNLESCFERPARPVCKGVHDAANSFLRKRLWKRILVRVRESAGRDWNPRAILRRKFAGADPRYLRAAFSPRVRKLHAGNASLPL